MQSISDYVNGLNISEDKAQIALNKLNEAGFTRYDRYYWQEIEDIINGVVNAAQEG